MFDFGVDSENEVGILKKVWRIERQKKSGKHALKWEIKRAILLSPWKGTLMSKLIMISRCLQKEKMYVILRPFNVADEDIIRCGIWKLRLQKCKFEKNKQLPNHEYN